jgi:hypothetical protein
MSILELVKNEGPSLHQTMSSIHDMAFIATRAKENNGKEPKIEQS